VVKIRNRGNFHDTLDKRSDEFTSLLHGSYPECASDSKTIKPLSD
jgi:hypothetical protein